MAVEVTEHVSVLEATTQFLRTKLDLLDTNQTEVETVLDEVCWARWLWHPYGLLPSRPLPRREVEDTTINLYDTVRYAVCNYIC